MIQSNFIKKKLFYKNIFILIIFSQFNFSANLLKSEEIETNIGFQDFIKLPNKKNINNESNGKTDIFSFEGFQNDKITNSIKLLGVYSTKQGNFAIIDFNNQIGEVKIGDVGSKDTKLIPKDYKLIEINIDKFSINLESKNNIFEIKG